MRLAPVKTPVVAKKMFPNYVWDIAPTKKELYLTFDDGPTPDVTNWTLDILRQYDAKATFFCIGSNVEQYPDIFNNIINEGHVVGNHTQNHVKGWSTRTKAYLKDVNHAQSIINSKISTNQSQIINLKSQIPNLQSQIQKNLFRPPYGQIKPKQGKKLIDLGFQIIMWDVLSFDWEQDLSEEKCLANIISKSKDGSIIVFHDSVKASRNMMYALPKVLDYFSKKGFQFKAINL